MIFSKAQALSGCHTGLGATTGVACVASEVTEMNCFCVEQKYILLQPYLCKSD